MKYLKMCCAYIRRSCYIRVKFVSSCQSYRRSLLHLNLSLNIQAFNHSLNPLWVWYLGKSSLNLNISLVFPFQICSMCLRLVSVWNTESCPNMRQMSREIDQNVVFFKKNKQKNKDKAPNCINYQYKAVVALCCGAVSLPILLVHKVDIVSKDRLNF